MAMDADALLLTHMEDLAARARKRGFAHSKFLSPAEAVQVQSAFGNRRGLTLILDGGYPDAERTAAVFLAPGEEYPRESVLAGLLIRYRKQDSLRHPDILGAALGLGISRDLLGDILVGEGQAILVCLDSIADFICAELSQIGRVGVSLTRPALSEIAFPALALEERPVTVASLRLDVLISAAFHLSRSEAGERIRLGQVKLNHSVCENGAKPLSPGDIVSVRGGGRFKLLDLNGQSRKGKDRVILGFYR